MSYVYKGWRGNWETIHGEYRRVYRNAKHNTIIIKARGGFWYYRDSPGGQRSRVSFDRLCDAIDSLEDAE